MANKAVISLTTGLEVAQTWADLVHGTIATPINLNQNKASVGQTPVGSRSPPGRPWPARGGRSCPLPT